MTPQSRWTLETLFAGREESQALFEVVRQYIESLGAVEMAVTKTQVSFGAQRKFAWMWLPQIWSKKRPETCVVLTFGLKYEVCDPRIAEAVEPAPGRWTHHIVLEQASDFDEQVKAWLREAYAYGSEDRRRAGSVPDAG